jgi:hypothetical protein
VARLDAYAAREVLDAPSTRAILSAKRASSLSSVVRAAGLGAGALPADHQRSLSESVALGEAQLTRLLHDDKVAPGNPLKEVPQNHMSDRTQLHSLPYLTTEGEGS